MFMGSACARTPLPSHPGKVPEMKLNQVARFTLVGLHIFLAIGALYGAAWVVPTLPLEWLAGTPFVDYRVPALALGLIGAGALLAAALLLLTEGWGVLLSLLVGAAMAIFEVVETSVIGWDVWLHALGLLPALQKGLPTYEMGGVPTLLGIPVPLWLQPIYFLLGLVIVALALRLWARQMPGHELSGPLHREVRRMHGAPSTLAHA